MEIPSFLLGITERLKSSGHQAYIVGGAVRDIRLRRPVVDWDIATSAPPEKILSLFQHIRTFTQKHGTVTLIDQSGHYEVTTFKGKERFGHTIEEDLGHRDFTIDAMAYDTDLKIVIDPYRGQDDIIRRLVRAVRVPEDRFQEDPIRLLRAIRLVAELEFSIEVKTLEAISQMADRLSLAAPERIRDEIMKILMSPRPSRAFNLMMRLGLLDQFLPELHEGYRKRQNAYHSYTIYRHIMETLDRVKRDPVLKLTALFHDIAKPRVRKKIKGEWHFYGHDKASASLAAEIMERLRFGSKLTGRVKKLIQHHMIRYDSGWSDGAVRRFIGRVGLENIEPLFSFRRADILSHVRKDHETELLDELEKRIEILRAGSMALKTSDLAIDGHNIMEIMDISPGPEVGSIFQELLEQVIDHPELNTVEGLTLLLEQKAKKRDFP